MGTENEHEDTVDSIPAVRRYPWPAQPPASTKPVVRKDYSRHRTAAMVILFLVVFIGVGFLGDLATKSDSPIGSVARHLLPQPKPGTQPVQAARHRKHHHQAPVTAFQPTAIATIATAATSPPIPRPKPVRPPASPSASPPSSSPSSSPPPNCYPTTASGKCYLPGEYCPDAYHNSTGVTATGEIIVCMNNDGWRWEPYGTTGSSSEPPPTCSPPATGTPPDCVSPTCPPPSTGTPPVCATQTPPQTCPPPETGTPPVCATPTPSPETTEPSPTPDPTSTPSPAPSPTAS